MRIVKSLRPLVLARPALRAPAIVTEHVYSVRLDPDLLRGCVIRVPQDLFRLLLGPPALFVDMGLIRRPLDQLRALYVQQGLIQWVEGLTVSLRVLRVQLGIIQQQDLPRVLPAPQGLMLRWVDRLLVLYARRGLTLIVREPQAVLLVQLGLIQRRELVPVPHVVRMASRILVSRLVKLGSILFLMSRALSLVVRLI